MGLDIGPDTARRYAESIAEAGTVPWNGPMGAELEPFAAGTRTVAEVAPTPPAPRWGGGTVAALQRFASLIGSTGSTAAAPR
jgi:phosphoglycerate kinase